MTVRYRVLLDARRELFESADFYNHEQPGLGGEFVLEYEAVIEFMQERPDAGVVVTSRRLQLPVRKFVFKRFRHTLFVVTMPDELVVVAVAPQRRKPFCWRKRLAKVQP